MGVENEETHTGGRGGGEHAWGWGRGGGEGEKDGKEKKTSSIDSHSAFQSQLIQECK